MSAHDHRDYVAGCFRCDLSRVEVTGTRASRDPADLVASIRRGLDQAVSGQVASLDHLLDD